MNHRQPPPTPSLHPNAFQRALRERVERDPGLCAALCALSFFRNRHEPGRRFPSGRPAESDTLAHRDRVRLARHYIADARFHRFRGSVNRILNELATGGAQ